MGAPIDEHGQRQPGGRQKLLNESWPAHPAAIKDAPKPIAVIARLAWEVDGEEFISTRALRWSNHHVFVSCWDRRNYGVIGFWLQPGDVKRQ